MRHRLALVPTICAAALLALSGCVSFARFLFSDGESNTITPKLTAIPSSDAAIITRQMLGIVDRVAKSHALNALLPTGTYLRHYGSSDTVGPHGEVDVFVLSHQDASLPTIVVQGTVGEAGEVSQITSEIRKTLTKEVNGVEFRSWHAY